MQLSSKAQSTLETAVLITLILGGILLALPVTSQEVKGWLKSYEEGVRLSGRDNFQQSDPGEVQPPDCDPGDWNQGACGDETNGCNYGERIYFRNKCPGIPDVDCRVDDTCCTDWELTCDPSQGDVSCCGINYPCPDCEGYMWQRCGDSIINEGCRNSPACCFDCVPDPPDRNSSVCPLDDQQLPDDTRSRLKRQCSVPAGSNPKCEYTCNNGYYFDQQTRSCLGCPAPSEGFWTQCHCTAHGTGAGCIARGQRIIHQLYCPVDMSAEAGHCQYTDWRARAYVGRTAIDKPKSGQIGGNPEGWECEGYIWNGRSGQKTCQHADFEIYVWCMADIDCPRPIMEDYEVKIWNGSLTPPCKPGWKEVGYHARGVPGAPDNQRHCARVRNYTTIYDAGTCNAGRLINYRGDAFDVWEHWGNYYCPNVRGNVSSRYDWRQLVEFPQHDFRMCISYELARACPYKARLCPNKVTAIIRLKTQTTPCVSPWIQKAYDPKNGGLYYCSRERNLCVK